MKLNKHERLNPLWVQLKKNLDERLTKLRAQNDSPQLDAQDTAALRGRIAELKLILAFDKDDPEIE